jgi:ribosomal protein L11 methyltransferase
LPTFSLILETSPELAEVRSAELWELGALGVEVRDGEGTPMPGAAPPEGRAVLLGWFAGKSQAEEARVALGGRVEEVADRDWGEAWKAGLRPLALGRVLVRPSWAKAEAPPGSVEVVLDPGMAFGTGTHPTTALCLAFLSDLLGGRPGASVLDVGTGSGLLAIAAHKLGAVRVRANDNDPVAVEVARENASRNGVRVEVTGEPLAGIDGRYDVVVANILANTLVELAPEVAEHLAEGGVAAVSGILASQEDEVRAAYAAAGLTDAPALGRRDGEWSLLAFRRGRGP